VLPLLLVYRCKMFGTLPSSPHIVLKCHPSREKTVTYSREIVIQVLKECHTSREKCQRNTNELLKAFPASVENRIKACHP
jgi:hypothetical protein